MSVKMLKPRVEVIKPERGASIATERTRGRKAQEIRKQIMLRDGFTCQECKRLTLHGENDHIVPLHMGGKDTPDNMQWLCVECHDKKSEGEGKARRGE